ncbi:MAG TPA: serine/threonine-protein kinase [Planctomycetaceae bacterium]|jgi:serine/threonine protein kinase|nr:serine/threonine-protein kinase [Planctomycetaceae bacterium]
MSETPKDAKSIFLAALDIQSPGERAAFVARSCEGDDPLRKRVEDLLRAYGASGGPLDKMAAALAPTRVGEPIREQVGSTIGSYKLMEQIGEGGFGLVFVAEQQQPIRRKVALKIIKPGMDTRDVIARFEAERQALALMDHPNIARVLDAGTTESGRPYFVMELVRGIPITEYCDQAQLTPRERLELFVPVCNAIQHAHLKGIIHRDVKPSNVLITLHDDRPVVKVIDFGVAKALHQQLTDRTIYTRYAQMIGTPLYMSPEQAQMSGLDIDTRSDIYSLGVLLYELLTGSTPFNKERLAKAAYDELLKIIREEEPPKPSVRLSQSTDTLPSIAAQRKTEPAKLSKMFSGDLDWIAMKALEKDRTRRYETANAFAADVSRYLNDEPVEASPPSAAYRIRKFARKNRKSVIAVAALMAVLVLGIAGTSWGLFRAKQAEQAANASQQKTTEALRQVTKERDAKVTALTAEAAARDQAEHHLANGLVRPIGFSERPTDSAELRSFVDWSAIKESPFKQRVLAIALENPDTALRVARRAEHVVQSCVGLSPTRRAEAMKVVSARQRDLGADPRIRIAACWLALELGSTDLPAWPECSSYLSDPKNMLGDRFGEFVTLALRRSDPQQVSQLDSTPLLRILEASDDQSALLVLSEVSGKFLSRLDSAQMSHAWNAVIAKLEGPGGFAHNIDAVQGFVALAPRLERAQTKRGWDAIIARLSEQQVALDALFLSLYGIGDRSSTNPRLEPAQADRVLEALIAHMKRSHASVGFYVGLGGLAPQLEPAQAQRAWDALISFLQANPGLYFGGGYEQPRLTAVAARLSQQHVQEAADALIKNPGSSPHATRYGLMSLAPRLERAQAVLAGNALLAQLGKSPNLGAAEVIAALTPQLELVQIERAAGVLVETIEKWPEPEYGSAYGGLDSASAALSALATRLNAQQIRHTSLPLLALARRFPASSAAGLAALASRLEPVDASRAWDALIASLRSRELHLHPTKFAAFPVGNALAALAPRLDPTYVPHAAADLVAIVTNPIDATARVAAIEGIIVLARRLEGPAATRVWRVLITDRDKLGSHSEDLVWDCLVALAPFLDSQQRDDLCLSATADVLDHSCSQYPYSNDAGGWEPSKMCKSVRLVGSVTSQRSLAKLLSHPGCVGEERECLLKRFEELVAYDGKAVFLKPNAADGTGAQMKDREPPRRFHNLHDAAAWIQQNWPDFDLETNCPATWRGSR